MNAEMMIGGESSYMMGPLGFIVMVMLAVLPFWFIFGKAGHSQWLSLLMLVPLLNIGMLFYLAFSDCPALNNKSQ